MLPLCADRLRVSGRTPGELSGRADRVRQVVASGGDHLHATRHEQHNPQLLGDEIASEAARIFDKIDAWRKVPQ
jgi:hypothetical protein